MGTQVTYKGGQLASFANDTRILKTAGKYMEDDVTIVDDAGDASAIVITDEPDSHGGTIRHINAVVLTGDTVIPEALLSGYTAHDGTGQAIVGTYTPQGATLGSKTITVNGTYNAINDQLDGYSQVNVNVTPSLQAKTATPTESQQSITPDTGYVGLSSVTINAISDTYVGSAINRRDSTDLTASGATVSVPAGYYATAASKSITSGTAGTPTATKGTVSSHSVTVTPSVTNTTGYITGGTKTGTAVTVSASELVSGTKSISSNGTGIDVTNYAAVNVSVAAPSPTLQAKTNINPTTSSQTITADNGYDGLSSVQINAVSSGTLSDLEYVDDDPSFTIDSSSGLISVSGGYSASYHPVSSSGWIDSSATMEIDAGVMGTYQLSTQAATTITPTTSQQTAVAAGKYTTGAVTVAAMPSGSATAPASISGSSATVSTGTNTLTLTKTVSNTPQVTAGYISSGTAGNSSVSLTASITTKAATTYHPSTTDQTIASGTYTTGTQTIKAVTISGLSASSILSGTTVKIGDSTDDDCVTSVAGSVVIQHYYTGSSTPSSTLGVNGDIYLQTS